jgi:hypothetical protein
VGVFPEITIEVAGVGRVRQMLQASAEALGGFQDIWDEVVHPWFLGHMGARFATEGRYGGNEWADYSAEPHYALYKKAIVGHFRLLRWEMGGEYERLYPSLTDPNHPEHIYQRDDTKARMGTSVPYAKDLEGGGVGPFGERYPGRTIISATQKQLTTGRDSLWRRIQRRLGEKIRDARIRA